MKIYSSYLGYILSAAVSVGFFQGLEMNEVRKADLVRIKNEKKKGYKNYIGVEKGIKKKFSFTDLLKCNRYSTKESEKEKH